MSDEPAVAVLVSGGGRTLENLAERIAAGDGLLPFVRSGICGLTRTPRVIHSCTLFHGPEGCIRKSYGGLVLLICPPTCTSHQCGL